MKCPDEIQKHLLNILSVGVINIRFMLAQKQYDLSGIEANHIHNLPSIIENFSYNRLNYYLDIEAKQYLNEMGAYVREDYRASLSFLLSLKSEKLELGNN